MKADFKIISTVLIVVLTVLLVIVLVSYYSKPIDIDTSISDNPTLANHNKEVDNIPQENNLTSGEQVNENINQSGDINSGENAQNIEDDSHINLPSSKPKDEDKTVIITSDDTMTNKEKREILTELDTTLMELLEVVDKVQTVDETRLVTDEEGEVQK